QGTSLLGNNILILTLFNINLILLVVLLLLLSRNIVKFIFDRHQNVLGSRFRTKLILAFVGFSIIPSVLLFIVASGLLTSSINNWFSIQVEKSLKSSFDVAQSFYEKAKTDTLYSAEVLSLYIAKNDLLQRSAKPELAKAIEEKKAELHLSGVELFDARAHLLNRSIDKNLVKSGFLKTAPELVQKGAQGEKLAIIRSSKAGDIIIGIAPVYSPVGPAREIVGVITVSTTIKSSLVSKMEEITRLFEEYKQMVSLKGPIKSSYLLSFFIITLLIIFSAVWFGYYLARGITIPIQKLAEATEAVANGNLDVRVETGTRDEIGVLITSFNKMTEDLKQGKLSLEDAYRSLKDSSVEIEQRRAYMETVLENVATGVISIDKDGDITTFNHAAESILGIHKEDIRGKGFQEILSRIPTEVARDIIRKVRGGGGIIENEEIQFNMNNRNITLRIKMTTLYDADGHFLGNVIVFDDLSELIKVQRIAAWQEVAKNLAHEIKNPLTPIQLCTERLRKKHYERDENYDKIFEDCTTTIIREVNALKMLVNEFSSFARMPAAKPSINNINAIIRDVVLLYSSAHKNVCFVENFTDPLPEINVDREQIKRAFINLFENAVEAVNGNGHVWIKTELDPKNHILRVMIADDGMGVSPEDKDKLFVPYFSRKKTGTGLGLAIVNRILSDHNGRIMASDNSPTGTKFIIELPV
ncbi:MAG: HAMP domain-containing protein, partial [Nitrospirae bacterium]|nr:HAMP domain-containing protein [Nitrospirota bacterium]